MCVTRIYYISKLAGAQGVILQSKRFHFVI